jgi:hypothetical protein
MPAGSHRLSPINLLPRRIKMKIVHIVVVAIATMLAMPAFSQTKPAAKPTSSDMEIFRQKVKADKKLIVSANMQLTEAEAKAFWPVYEAYQKDLAAINDRTAKTVMEYADAYNKGPVPDATAKKLISDAIAIEESEVKLKRSYLPKLEKAIPGTKVARYFQIESKIRAVIKYELAANIPLVE